MPVHRAVRYQLHVFLEAVGNPNCPRIIRLISLGVGTLYMHDAAEPLEIHRHAIGKNLGENRYGMKIGSAYLRNASAALNEAFGLIDDRFLQLEFLLWFLRREPSPAVWATAFWRASRTAWFLARTRSPPEIRALPFASIPWFRSISSPKEARGESASIATGKSANTATVEPLPHTPFFNFSISSRMMRSARSGMTSRATFSAISPARFMISS